MKGIYKYYIDDKFAGESQNIITTEGWNHFLSLAFKAGSPNAGFFVALFSGAVTPLATWTGANFTANASEITSGTEGYSNLNRVQWLPGTISNGVLSNSANPAQFTIACSTTINVSGAALLSASAKGATTGTLMSATRYPNVQVLNNGAVFSVVYEIQLGVCP